MADSFYCYDLETSGTDPKWDRIVQFAGMRTDADLNPVDDEFCTYVQLPDDVLPNPNTGQFSVQLHFPTAADYRMMIFDGTGRPVYESSDRQVLTTTVRPDLDNLSAGIYLLRLESGTQTVVRRIVITD